MEYFLYPACSDAEDCTKPIFTPMVCCAVECTGGLPVFTPRTL